MLSGTAFFRKIVGLFGCRFNTRARVAKNKRLLLEAD